MSYDDYDMAMDGLKDEAAARLEREEVEIEDVTPFQNPAETVAATSLVTPLHDPPGAHDVDRKPVDHSR